MTLLNFTFQEASPLISYSGLWTEGSPANDTFWASYNGSFRVTQVAQSAATFTFLGTAVSLFGATRPNHGNYTVNLDLQPQFVASGFTSDNFFNKSLWNAEGLSYAQHTVTLTNVPVPPNPFLDLDFVSIERQIGQPGDTIYQLSLDDTSPSVSFVGPWESVSGVSSAYQGTLHSTQDANAQVTFSFQGASLEVYGQYANAPYTVTLDNAPPVNLKGLDVDLTPDFQHPQTLLYLVDGLSDGVNHTVTLTNSISNVNRPFYFDYAVVSSTFNLNGTSASLNGTSTSSNGTSSPSPSTSQSPGGNISVSGNSNSNRHTPVAAIAGGIVGAVAVIMILGLSVFIQRRRRARDELRKELMDNEAKPYILGADVHSSEEPLEQRQLQPETRPSPPVSRRVEDFAPRTKDRPVYYPAPTTDQSSSASSPLSPQERPESVPFRVDTVPISSTSASRTHLPHSRSGSGSGSGSGSTSRRHKHNRDPSSSSRGRTEASRETAVQEEDAGIVIDPEGSTLKPLPPAYNPTWERN